MNKVFRLAASDLRDLATGRGSCIASDMITVEGRPVGWMYRQEPLNKIDSGWRFFSGLESDAYADNEENLAIYDINTIANYDPDIIPFLSAETGSAFERSESTGRFEPVLDWSTDYDD